MAKMSDESGLTLAQVLDQHVREGELYSKEPDGSVRCYACGHRCLIRDGRGGVCRVRYNRGGKLLVPYGYVGALQCDPIEKKPFFHAYPGTDALSLGMLGCDFHCAYCLLSDVRLATDEGMVSIGALYRRGWRTPHADGGEISVLEEAPRVYTHRGNAKPIDRMFKHRYRGTLLSIKPWFLPVVECTSEHEFLAVDREGREASFVPAGRLTKQHRLAVPKRFDFSEDVIVEVGPILRTAARPHRVRHLIPARVLRAVCALTDQGLSSRQIGGRLGKDPSHIRHPRSRLRRGVRDLEQLGVQPASVVVEAGTVRFPKEHRPGIPAQIELGIELATLFGYYCAEGCVVRSADRVHAATLTIALGHHERALAEEVQRLFRGVFGIEALVVPRETTTAVVVQKASIALLFEACCGGGASEKRVPTVLFRARRRIAEAFLNAYVAGDGYRSSNGSTTIGAVSEELAYGILWLALKLGHLPAFHHYAVPRTRRLLGRVVHQSPRVYVVRWQPRRQKRNFWEDDRYYYVPIRSITERHYDGAVYNLEVSGDHSYLANGVATHNCQNWVTSQALRDPVAGAPPEIVTPQQLVALARRAKASVVASTYNEPLITSEWAVAIFREARAAGFDTAYISNGNGTAEVLEYLRPWVSLYKVDLKSFNDAHYRQLGGVLAHVLETIRRLHQMRFWVEIVTLVVPGFNDSDEELRQIAEFLVSVSPDIPWHVTAFHKDYKMQDPDNTTAETLLRAAEIGMRAGLRYVYAGNLPGRVGRFEHTYCPQCRALLIERVGYEILAQRIRGGRCPDCGTAIPGVWGSRSEGRGTRDEGRRDRPSS